MTGFSAQAVILTDFIYDVYVHESLINILKYTPPRCYAFSGGNTP